MCTVHTQVQRAAWRSRVPMWCQGLHRQLVWLGVLHAQPKAGQEGMHRTNPHTQWSHWHVCAAYVRHDTGNPCVMTSRGRRDPAGQKHSLPARPNAIHPNAMRCQGQGHTTGEVVDAALAGIVTSNGWDGHDCRQAAMHDSCWHAMDVCMVTRLGCAARASNLATAHFNHGRGADCLGGTVQCSLTTHD